MNKRIFFQGVTISAAMLFLVTLSMAQVSILKPAPGDFVSTGDKLKIRWNADDRSNARSSLQLWDGERSEWLNIVKGIPVRQGAFEWKIPNIPSGKLYRIRLNSDGDEKNSISSSYFTIDWKEQTSDSLANITTSLAAYTDLSEHGGDILLSPNPARDNVDIVIGEGVEVASVILFDALGRTIRTIDQIGKTEQNFSRTRVQLDNINSGTYYLQCKLISGELISKKLVINK